MAPSELKQWQAGLGLSEMAMAGYLGIPVHTLKKWIDGTRTPDAAPRRLFASLQRIGQAYPVLHGELLREARAAAPDRAPAPRGRPRKGIGAPSLAEASQAPKTTDSEIPDWLRMAV